jgi:O-antigen ligase
MKSQIAFLVFSLVIALLFRLDRNSKVRLSPALWIPVIWLMIASSRNVAQWIQFSAPVEEAAGGDAYTEGNSIDRNVLSLLMFVGVVTLARRGKALLEVMRANIPILAYFLYCAVSVLWSEYPSVGFKRWFRALGDVVMVFVILTDPHWRESAIRLLKRVGFVLLPMSILVIRYFSEIGRAYSPWDGSPSWTGVTTSKNLLGMISLLFGLASEWQLIQWFLSPKAGRAWGVMIANGVVLSTAGYLLHTAHSATSVACFALGSAVMIFASVRAVARRSFLIHIAVGSVVFLAFSSLFLNLGSSLVEGLGRDSSLTGRTDIWNIVLSLVTNPILGTGYESFWLGWRLEKMRRIYWNNVNQAHNGYLEVYLNLGWVGISFLTVALLSGYRRVVESVRSQQGGFGSLLLAYFLVTVVYNFTEAAFKMMHPVWFCFLLAIGAMRMFGVEETVLAGGEPKTSVSAQWFGDGIGEPGRERKYLEAV